MYYKYLAINFLSLCCRIFTQNDADIEPENDTLEQDKNIAGKMCKFFLDDLNTDIIEVIFLDVNNNNENEKAHEVCLHFLLCMIIFTFCFHVFTSFLSLLF